MTSAAWAGRVQVASFFFSKPKQTQLSIRCSPLSLPFNTKCSLFVVLPFVLLLLLLVLPLDPSPFWVLVSVNIRHNGHCTRATNMQRFHTLTLAGAVSAESIEKNIGPGAADGTVPTDLEQATGLEREELLAKLEGKELFDMEPLNMTHIGTVQDPIVVKSHDAIRFVGCTGM